MKFALIGLGVLLVIGILALLVFGRDSDMPSGSASDRSKSPKSTKSKSTAAPTNSSRAGSGDWSAGPGGGAGGGQAGGVDVDGLGLDEGTGTKENWIRAKSGEHEGKAYHVGRRTVTLGREPASFIQLGDSEVSREHAEVRASDERVEVVDLHSKEGTTVEGEEIPPDEPVEIEDGMSFTIGENEFEFVEEGDFRDAAQHEIKETGDPYESKTGVVDGGEKFEGAIREALEAADGNIGRAADRMDMEREAFEKMLELADVDPDDFRK